MNLYKLFCLSKYQIVQFLAILTCYLCDSWRLRRAVRVFDWERSKILPSIRIRWEYLYFGGCWRLRRRHSRRARPERCTSQEAHVSRMYTVIFHPLCHDVIEGLVNSEWSLLGEHVARADRTSLRSWILVLPSLRSLSIESLSFFHDQAKT